MDDNYNAYGRDDDYSGLSGQFEEDVGYAYDMNSGAGAMPASRVGTNINSQQGTMPMTNTCGRAQAGGAGVAAGASRGSHGNLASIKHNIQHLRCKDGKCDFPIAWRNAEDFFVGGRGAINSTNGINAGSAGNAGLNASGSLGPMYANQDERDYQMKLMDILHLTGLPLPDLAASTGFNGGIVPSFDYLPAVSARADSMGGTDPSGRGGISTRITGAELPRQRTRAWECARFAVESDRREFYFHNRVVAQNVVFSDYCKIHTCRYFFSREQCMQKKIQFDAVCNTHTTCPVQNCPTAKTQIIDLQQSNGRVITWLRDEFCKTHGCAVDDCGYRCDKTEDGDDLRFCPAPASSKASPAADTVPSSQACQKMAQAGFELCKKHIECAQDKCPKPRSVLNIANIPIQKDSAMCGIEYYKRKAYLLYCSDHAYCAERSCSLLRKKPAVFCFKHVCNETGCGLATTEELKFCNKHLCRESDCSQGVGEDHLYCINHECEAAGCTSKDTGGNFCFNHAHVRSQKKGELDAHAKTERLARVLQPSRALPDYQSYHYPGHPFTSIGSVYGEGSVSSRSSKSSHRHHSRHESTSTSTRGRKRNSGTSYASSFDEGDEDAAESTDDSSRSCSRWNRDSGGSGSANMYDNLIGNVVPMHGGPAPQMRQPMPGPCAPRLQVSQQHPQMLNGGSNAQGGLGGPGGAGGPYGPGSGGSSGGPPRPMLTHGARPTSSGAGPAQNGVRGGPPQNMGNYRGSQGGMGDTYNDDETGGQFR
ncbi:hypothetical protein F503_03925 [Ophiostoma piceae UAMH 11346]|uniref:Uncharacterized protein n=1 Tax=Ophiostoma piceae (strain UAMH 11346) TaxID=1262450 RepID=S3CWX5_OPHP1|nr:hypothetical protein F503_03925 [Ophiostoma piceae UAMH 11346]